MALLSNKKVSVFNESLINLMEMLLEKHWNKRSEIFEEMKANPESSNETKSSKKAAFIMDQMHTLLDAERQPEANLVNKFDLCSQDPEILQDYDDLFVNQKLGSRKNFLMQRRVQVTPTLILFSKM